MTLTKWEPSPPDQISLRETILFAARAHAEQFRLYTGLPYIVHPMAVLTQLGEWGIKDLVAWKAAICHDIFEECPHVTDRELRLVIGNHACEVVKELTFIPTLGEGQPNKARQKQQYMASFANSSIESLVVKFADRCCNTMDFMKVQPAYAPKYWNKAQSLRDAVHSREPEIRDYYGPDVYSAMKMSGNFFAMCA